MASLRFSSSHLSLNMYTFFYGFYHFILTNQLYVFHVNGFVRIKLSEHFSFFRNLLLRIHWSNNIYGKTIRLPWKIWQFRKINGLKWQNMCQWRYITVEVSRHPLPFTNVWATFVICICMQIKCHTVYCVRLGLLHQSLIILQIRILMPLFRHSGNTLGKCAFTILIKVKKKEKTWKESRVATVRCISNVTKWNELEVQAFQKLTKSMRLNCQSEQLPRIACFLYFTRIDSECDHVNLVYAVRTTHTQLNYSYSIRVCKLHVWAITNANLIQQQRQQKHQYANADI